MKVLMTGGGTGGHIYPALAIADRIRQDYPESQICFVGNSGDLEEEVARKSGYEFYPIPARWFYRGEGFFKTLTEFVKASTVTLAGIFRARRVMKKFRPDFVVGTGGFVSAPVLFAAKSRHIPCYMHEQNAYPGMANRLTARFCRKIFLGFDKARDHFRTEASLIYAGNPVRAAFFAVDRKEAKKRLGIREDAFTLLCFGGSLGSERINEIGYAYAGHVHDAQGKALILASGKRFWESVCARRKADRMTERAHLRFFPYIDDMPTCLAAADLVLCRAGALSLAEICTIGLPSLLIPYPHSADNHQFYNAKAMEEAGCSYLINDEEADPKKVIPMIDLLASDRARLEAMRKASFSMAKRDAAGVIVRGIMEDRNEVGTTPRPIQEEKAEDLQQREPIRQKESLRQRENFRQTEREPGGSSPREAGGLKQIARVRRRHPKKHYWLRFLLFIALCLALILFLRSDYFAIQEFKVEGNQYYRDEEVLTMAKAKKGDNIFFGGTLREIKTLLTQDSYFKSVEVKRKLPSTVEILVEEREQTAAILFGEKYIVIDDQGFVLRKTDLDPEITLLEGLTITKMKVGEPLEVEEKDTLETTLDMLKAMKGGDLYFKKIDVSRVILRCYIYDQLLIKGTAKDISSSIRTGDVQKVISDLFAQGITRGTITPGGADYISFSPLIDSE